MSEPSRKRLRVAVWALAVLAVLAGGAILAAPGYVLRRGLLLRWMNGDPRKLFLSYASASAPGPGRLIVTGLELRGGDPNVQWWFRMERAEIRYAPLDLLAKRFHATSVRATGLAFRIRQRLPAKHGTESARAPLPPIPGFGPVPVDGGPPFYPPPEPPENYWQVRIDDLVAPAREIWLDAYRYEGDARVAGSFSLWPQKRAMIGPVRIDFLGGTVAVGNDVAARRLHGAVEGRVAPFDPRAVRGNEVYRFVSGKAHAEGEVPSLAFLNYYLRDSPEPRLSGGRGKLGGDLTLKDGRGTMSATLAVERARAAYRKTTLAGSVTMDLRMNDWRPGEAYGLLHGTKFSLADLSTSPAKAKAPDGAGQKPNGTSQEPDGASQKPDGANQKPDGANQWWGEFDVGPGKLRSTDSGLELSGRVTSRCRDALPLYTLFEVGLPKWAQGIFRLREFRAAADVVLGPSVIEVKRLEASGGAFAVSGDYRSRGAATEGAFLVSTGSLAVGIDVDGPKPALKIAGAKSWFAARRARSGRDPR
jgi:hypothetical protein